MQAAGSLDFLMFSIISQESHLRFSIPIHPFDLFCFHSYTKWCGVRALNPRLLGYEPSVLPTELTPQRGGFNHVHHQRRASGLRLRNTQSLQRIQHISIIRLLWCPSSKAALSNSLSDALGTEHLCHFRRQCHSSTHNRAMLILTMAGSYSRCITVIVFDQSVMDVSEGEYEDPRWNCATPAAYVLHYTYSIEPSCSFRRWWTRWGSNPRPKLILDYNFLTQ